MIFVMRIRSTWSNPRVVIECLHYLLWLQWEMHDVLSSTKPPPGSLLHGGGPIYRVSLLYIHIYIFPFSGEGRAFSPPFPSGAGCPPWGTLDASSALLTVPPSIISCMHALSLQWINQRWQGFFSFRHNVAVPLRKIHILLTVNTYQSSCESH